MKQLILLTDEWAGVEAGGALSLWNGCFVSLRVCLLLCSSGCQSGRFPLLRWLHPSGHLWHQGRPYLKPAGEGNMSTGNNPSFLAEMRLAPFRGWPSGDGGAHPGAGPAVLPHHADRSTHGAQSWPAVQAEDHQRLLSPVWRTGEVLLQFQMIFDVQEVNINTQDHV